MDICDSDDYPISHYYNTAWWYRARFEHLDQLNVLYMDLHVKSIPGKSPYGVPSSVVIWKPDGSF